MAELQPGDVVRVDPGEAIPVDGIVITGRAFVRESDITGETFAALYGPGERVHSGTRVLDATLTLQATSSGTNREVDHLSAALAALGQRPAESQVLANRIVRWFLPVVLTLALGTFLFWSSHTNWQEGLFHGMAVLLVACPCGLGFATPVAVWMGLGRLWALGLLVKRGDAVERLARVDTVVFDKTGTLTAAEAKVSHFVLEPDAAMPESLVRTLVAGTERCCHHPIADVLRSLDQEGNAVAESVRILSGVGVEPDVLAGSRLYRVHIGLASALTPDSSPELPALAVLIDGRLVATIHLEEEPLAGLPEAVRELGALGIRSALMTGDTHGRAARIPIDERYARLTPEDKRRRVQDWQDHQRRVLFVGDGLNDTTAMAASTVSIAVNQGSPLATEVADVLWTSRSLAALPQAVRVARDTVAVIRWNLKFGVLYNVLGVTLASAGMLHPVVASLLMTGSSLMVTWRALQQLDGEGV